MPAACAFHHSVPKKAPAASPPAGEVLEWRSSAGQPYWYRLPKKTKNTKHLQI